MKITDDMLTEWFPADVKPKRVGWYECSFIGGYGRVMRRWSGYTWQKPTKADGSSGFTFGSFRGDSWRGLKSPAKEN